MKVAKAIYGNIAQTKNFILLPLINPLKTAGRFRQTCELARTFGRTGGVEFFNFLKTDSRILTQLADHGRNSEPLIVFAKVINHFPVVGSQYRNILKLPKSPCHIFVSVFRSCNKTFVVKFYISAIYLYIRHDFPPAFFWFRSRLIPVNITEGIGCAYHALPFVLAKMVITKPGTAFGTFFIQIILGINFLLRLHIFPAT
jgi:hypothetical protein